MERRRFLKWTGLALLGLLAVPHAVFAKSPTVTSTNGVQYHADRQGRIYVSRDSGRTWRVHTNLGRGYWVRRLALDRAGRVTARVGFGGRDFGLVLSRDERSWRTT